MSARAELAPYRIVDGARLADRVTPAVLRVDRAARERLEPLTDRLERLGWASPFHPPHDPRRRALLAWTLSQPDFSVEPHQLFEKALEIAQGSVQRALLLCWDQLRQGWMRPPLRNIQPQTLKLFDITGERELFDGNFPGGVKELGLWGSIVTGQSRVEAETIRGDVFSAWYHFFGTAIDAFHRQRATAFPRAEWATLGAIFVQETLFTNRHVDAHKRWILDTEGARFGGRLARNIQAFADADDLPAGFGEVSYVVDAPHRLPSDWAGVRWHPRGYYWSRSRDRPRPLMAELLSLHALKGREDAESLKELAAAVRVARTRIDLAGLVIDPPENVVAAHAISLLGYRRDEASERLLVEMITSGELQAEFAILALAARDSGQTLAQIVRLTRHPTVLVRIAAARALGALSTWSPEAYRLSATLMNDVPGVAAAAATAARLHEHEIPTRARFRIAAILDRWAESDLAEAHGKASRARAAALKMSARLGAAGAAAALTGSVSCYVLLRALGG